LSPSIKGYGFRSGYLVSLTVMGYDSLLTRIEQIQVRRQEIASELLKMLSSLLVRYIGSGCGCPVGTDCDTLTLGKLTRALNAVQLYPIPLMSAVTSSINELFSVLRLMELLPVCEALQRKGRKARAYYNLNFNKSNVPFTHLDEEIRRKLADIECGVRGIELSNARRR
jgi:hypothetical protein